MKYNSRSLNYLDRQRQQAEDALKQANDELQQDVRRRITELDNMRRLLSQEIIDRRCAETETTHTKKKLLHAENELLAVQRLADIGMLAAVVAHELRNPLAGIKVACYNLRRKAGSPGVSAHLATIENKVGESDRIITDLLSYSRLQKPQMQRVHLYDILEEVTQLAAGKYAQCKVEIVKRYDGLRNRFYEVDPQQMKVVFHNLLNNAYEALVRQTGTVELAAEDDQDDGELRIWVGDNGQGIEPENLQKIGQPFFTTKSKGTGLGLALTFEIIRMHGGTITVASEAGKGTRFCIAIAFT